MLELPNCKTSSSLIVDMCSFFNLSKKKTHFTPEFLWEKYAAYFEREALFIYMTMNTFLTIILMTDTFSTT